jgi:hypothetical protein
MAIDNPKEKFEQQYMREPEKSLFDLAIFGGKLAFPKAALPLEIFKRLGTGSQNLRLMRDYRQCGTR